MFVPRHSTAGWVYFCAKRLTENGTPLQQNEHTQDDVLLYMT